MSTTLQIKQSLNKIKVLLVEDDPIMASLIRDVLDIMGFKNINMFRNGDDAFKDIVTNSYDLILCDWRMAGLNGIEFTKKLRAYEAQQKRFTPLIMVTGKAHEDDVREARDAGVTEYLIKPFSIYSLCEKVKSILERPRDFVVAEEYTGPDRRRRDDSKAIPNGVDRREQ